MRLILQKSLALAAGSLFIFGCAVPTVSNQLGPDITGNWQFSAIDDFYHNDKIGGLAGSLVSQGTSVTGVMHGSGCVAATEDVDFAGTEDAKGNLTLTSTNLANNVATITGMVTTLPSGTYIQSSIAVSGSGPCTMAPYLNYPGSLYAPLNGSYTASLSSSTNATATLTGSLTAAATNADGEIPETGTFTLATSTCSSNYSFTGVVVGSSVQGTLSGTSGSSNGPTMSGYGGIVTLNSPSGGCPAGTFTGTLTAK